MRGPRSKIILRGTLYATVIYCICLSTCLAKDIGQDELRAHNEKLAKAFSALINHKPISLEAPVYYPAGNSIVIPTKTVGDKVLDYKIGHDKTTKGNIGMEVSILPDSIFYEEFNSKYFCFALMSSSSRAGVKIKQSGKEVEELSLVPEIARYHIDIKGDIRYNDSHGLATWQIFPTNIIPDIQRDSLYFRTFFVSKKDLDPSKPFSLIPFSDSDDNEPENAHSLEGRPMQVEFENGGPLKAAN